MMNNDNNEKEVVVNEQSTHDELTLLEQSKIAEAEEKRKQEIDTMRTKLGAERALQRLINEEGFVIEENYEEQKKKRVARVCQ